MPSPGLNPDRSLGWIRRILPVFARQRPVFAAAVAAGLAVVAVTVAVPIVIGRGVDAAAAGDDLSQWVLALAVLGAARFGLGYAYRYGLFRSAHRLDADLRNLVYERLTELSFSYWDRTQTGQVISRANSDIRSIQLLFAFAPLVATQMVMLVMGSAAMVWLSLPLTLVAMAPLPLVLYVGIRLRNRVFPLSWVTQARMADLATIVDENIQGAQIVRTFAQEHNQVRTLARSARRLRWAGTATADARARHAPIMEALPRLGLALVLLVGGLLAIDGSVAVGDIVAFNAYVLIMAAPFRMIGFVMIQWQRASAAAQRVFEILDESPEITERPDAVTLTEPVGRVELDDVTFAYTTSSSAAGGSTRVIEDFSLTVEPGETVAVVGRTGSGKSTIARLLPRFYDVDRGAVRIDGIDVRDLCLSDLRRAVTVVTDDPFLFATSVRDNVAFARPDADEASVAVALVDAAAGRFVASMPSGTDTELGERGSTISGGQRQRLAIARALLADPAVLVLDDATSAIDSEVEERIHAALRERRTQRTTILIAHRLSTIALADRVVFISGGRVAATGSHRELLATVPEYARVLTDIGATDDTGRTPADPPQLGIGRVG
ncbi:MAG: ABC transporter ATP-binding protein [Acidimicrobiaceae bacterium]|nr:ABC transporter ATP-binding protein [Acidimicrobiaceae bacterium]MYE65952.1 ABC transporter ATP-binding protein [Acidimicrobiaceae bacterium]MYI15762.1 ABC transporter ATP-binding protein [Acidimicrobiaceae bacterium]